MTATTTQMGRPGGGGSHTPRLDTLTWLEMIATHTHTYIQAPEEVERMVVWSACVQKGDKKKEFLRCANCVPPWAQKVCVLICGCDRLDELSILAYPSAATGSHGSGPDHTATWVSFPTAHHWEWHTRTLSHRRTHAELRESCPELANHWLLSFCLLFVFTFPSSLLLSTFFCQI